MKIGQKIRRFLAKLFLTHKRVIPSTTYFPFTVNQGNFEVVIPLERSFRFVHEPVRINSNLSNFIGRAKDVESMTERILFSEGGSFLVTGYRGVGKTSFIYQVIRKLEESLVWAEAFLGKTEIVDIHLNVARPLQPSELMHFILRRLYERLIEKGIYYLLDAELQNDLTLAYYRTSLNMARKLSESSENSFGVPEASLSSDWMKASIKMSWSSKYNKTKNQEMSYLGYDDKAAEHDIISVSRRLASGYFKREYFWKFMRFMSSNYRENKIGLKIIFVFDELDKLDELNHKNSNNEPIIDQILASLKNLFTTSGVTFVFVAGKDLQERWLDDIGKGDSIYESVFSFDKYLPCLWNDINEISDKFVDKSKRIKSYDQAIFENFKKYLAYKGRGIPRRTIRTFNQYVKWHEEHPMLALTRQNIRKVKFFADLQDELESNEKSLFGVSHEEIRGTQADKHRLGIYYLIDWILRQGNSEFTFDDLLSATKLLSIKISLAEKIAPEICVEIIRILLKADYIQEIKASLRLVKIDEMGIVDIKKTPENKRYKITPRRLVEMSGFGVDNDVNEDFSVLSPTIPHISPIQKDLVLSESEYKIIREIGRGGMGIVYEAYDQRNNVRLAIKIMSDTKNQLLVERFKREAMIMEKLDHPNIVKLYKWGENNGQPYIAMEYLDGITLERAISRLGKLDSAVACSIFNSISEGINYLHGHGLVRNDIKPNNIMLTSTGRICLIDFGITKPQRSYTDLRVEFTTEVGMLIGTPQYMAPEQFVDSFADERSDIYSLGVVMYRVLTGKLPIEDENPADIIRKHSTGRLIPPSQLIPIQPIFNDLILKCLEIQPDDRFQTIDDVSNALLKVGGKLPPIEIRSKLIDIRKLVEEVESRDCIDTAVGNDNGSEVEGHTIISLPISLVPSTLPGGGYLSTVDSESDLQKSVHPSYKQRPEKLRIESNDTGAPISSLPYTYVSSSNLTNATPASNSNEVNDLLINHSNWLISLLTGSAVFNLKNLGFGYLLENKTNIGRGSENIIVLDDITVSRYHAEFTLKDNLLFVYDLNSYFGTYVNGERIVRRKLIKNGDEIRINSSVFRVSRLSYLGLPTLPSYNTLDSFWPSWKHGDKQN